MYDNYYGLHPAIPYVIVNKTIKQWLRRITLFIQTKHSTTFRNKRKFLNFNDWYDCSYLKDRTQLHMMKKEMIVKVATIFQVYLFMVWIKIQQI